MEGFEVPSSSTTLGDKARYCVSDQEINLKSKNHDQIIR